MRYHEDFMVIYKKGGKRIPGYKQGWKKVCRLPRGWKVPEGWEVLHEVCPHYFLATPIYTSDKDK